MNVQKTQGNAIKLIVLFVQCINKDFYPGLNNQSIEIDCEISDAVRDLNNVFLRQFAAFVCISAYPYSE
jgi:hypothetical protein